MHQRHLLPPVLQCVLEGVADRAVRTIPRDQRDTLRRRLGIVANADIMLGAVVQPLEIFADDHDIYFLEPASVQNHVRRSHVRVQIKRLAQRHIHRAVPFAHRRLERPFQRHAILLDGIERRFRNGIVVPGGRRGTGHLAVPGQIGANGVEHANGGFGDVRTDAVAGNERDCRGHVRRSGSRERTSRKYRESIGRSGSITAR